VPFLGAHLSIAGGYYKALEAAARYGMEACQLFTKNNNQWRAKPLGEDDISAFNRARQVTRPRWLLSHDCYLINLASPNEALYKQSIEAFVIEMERAERLGLDYLVTHPGACVGACEEAGIARVAAAIDETHRRCKGYRVMILLENTAGQGTCLGHRFEHLADIRKRVKQPARVGVCIDTCHAFAAGYPLAPHAAYRRTMKQLDAIVGLEHVKAFHLNDSKKPLGSRVDRHEHIGQGRLGLEPFRSLVNDRRFKELPMILETPKGVEDGVDLDAMNLATLRRLLRVGGRRSG
jgi:deoxyribonuclease-4